MKIADAIVSNRVRRLLARSRRDSSPDGTCSAGSLIVVLIGNLLRSRRGGCPAPLMNAKTSQTSGRCCSGDLVEGGVGDFKGLYLRSSLNHRSENLGHFWISSAIISLGVLRVVPQTDSECFFPALAHEGDLVLEPLLFSKQRNDFLFQSLCKLGHAIGLQVQVHSTCKHGSLSLVLCPRGIQITGFGQDDLKAPSVR